MTALIQRGITSGILIVWGILLSYFYASGRVTAYLSPTFQPWTLAAGLVLLILALVVWFSPSTITSGDAPSLAKGLGGTIFSGAVLTISLVLAVIVSPSQFSASTVLNRGLVSDANSLPGYKPPVEPALPTQDGVPGQDTAADPYMPRNADGQIRAETIDLIYAAEEKSLRADFENKEVEMIGQFMPAKSNNAKGDRFSLVRMYMVCCAADARPTAVTIQMDPAVKMEEMSWVKVVGTATFPVEGGRIIPLVVAKSVKSCDPPEEAMIY
ncbi:TIGR03943 family protein [Spartobacteria bacterium LR76]|nr:TIGR03943 family protein [Spartobacteria bacterium LR76]